MVLVFLFLSLKTGTGLKILVHFSLSLDMKPGTDNQKNGTENFSKNEEKVITRKVLLFSGTFPLG